MWKNVINYTYKVACITISVGFTYFGIADIYDRFERKMYKACEEKWEQGFKTGYENGYRDGDIHGRCRKESKDKG